MVRRSSSDKMGFKEEDKVRNLVYSSACEAVSDSDWCQQCCPSRLTLSTSRRATSRPFCFTAVTT